MHLNIEFAHIYSDRQISDEHEKSAKKAIEIISGLPATDTHCLTVLIDEYHPSSSNLLVTSFIDFLEGLGARPHYIVMEGDLRALAYKVLYSIPRKMRKGLCTWMNGRESFPCALLTATWYLARLGVFKESFPILEIGNANRSFKGDSILTILPESYKENEKRAVELIESSPWKFAADRIKFEWIEGL